MSTRHNPTTCPERYARDGKVHCPHVHDDGKVIL